MATIQYLFYYLLCSRPEKYSNLSCSKLILKLLHLPFEFSTDPVFSSPFIMYRNTSIDKRVDSSITNETNNGFILYSKKVINLFSNGYSSILGVYYLCLNHEFCINLIMTSTILREPLCTQKVGFLILIQLTLRLLTLMSLINGYTCYCFQKKSSLPAALSNQYFSMCVSRCLFPYKCTLSVYQRPQSIH